MEINFNGKKIELSSEYVGTARPWGHDYVKEHHAVTVKVDDVEFTFHYYCGGDELDEPELANALYCSLGDAISYSDCQDIDDFFHEYGYESVKECMKAYEGCKKEYENWSETGIDIFELSNWLTENYNI